MSTHRCETRAALQLWARLRPNEIETYSECGEQWVHARDYTGASVDLDFTGTEHCEHPDWSDAQQSLAMIAAYAVRLMVDEGWTVTAEPRMSPGSAMRVVVTRGDLRLTIIAMQLYDAVIQLRPHALVASGMAEAPEAV